MTDRHRSIRFGIFVILAALGLRIWAAPPEKPNTAAAAVSTETGQKVRSFPSLMGYSPEFPPETAIPALYPDLRFGEDEMPELTNTAGLETDLPALLAAPLGWDLREGAVLILSTHATESYTRKGEPYREVSSWRTLSEEYNMLSIGLRVGQLLEEGGSGSCGIPSFTITPPTTAPTCTQENPSRKY